MSDEEQLRQAAELADQAVAATARLKVGTWESVQSLALVSIAKSLVVLAGQQRGR